MNKPTEKNDTPALTSDAIGLIRMGIGSAMSEGFYSAQEHARATTLLEQLEQRDQADEAERLALNADDNATLYTFYTKARGIVEQRSVWCYSLSAFHLLISEWNMGKNKDDMVYYANDPRIDADMVEFVEDLNALADAGLGTGAQDAPDCSAPSSCPHSVCSQNYIDTGDRECIEVPATTLSDDETKLVLAALDYTLDRQPATGDTPWSDKADALRLRLMAETVPDEEDDMSEGESFSVEITVACWHDGTVVSTPDLTTLGSRTRDEDEAYEMLDRFLKSAVR